MQTIYSTKSTQQFRRTQTNIDIHNKSKEYAKQHLQSVKNEKYFLTTRYFYGKKFFNLKK